MSILRSAMLLLIPFIMLLPLLAFGEVEVGGSNPDVRLNRSTQDGVNRTLVNVGQVSMWIFADGKSANTPGGSSGLFFPRGNNPSTAAIFQDGFLWGGQVQDGGAQIVRVGGQTFSIGTGPGRIDENNTREFRDRIWRVRRDFASADLSLDAQELGSTLEAVRAQYRDDWEDWPADVGAPFYDADGDGQYNPGFFADGSPKLAPTGDEEFDPTIHADEPGAADADQVVWLVANDLDPGRTTTMYGSNPIGIELQVTLWAYRRSDPLGNIIFKQFRVIYKGTPATPANARIDSTYFVQWSDPDLGGAGDDFAGTDTVLSMIYAYNANSQDAVYSSVGLPPPASGYDFFAGPLVEDPDGEAIFGLKRRPGFRNLPMTTAAFFAGGGTDQDPPRGGDYNGTLQWFNLMRGFRPAPETPPDPWRHSDGTITKFRVPGDPVTGEGFIDANPGDRRILAGSGPFTLAKGDTQETVVAVIAALGSDRLSSVAVLKFFDRFAQEAFDNLFDLPKPQPTPFVEAVELDQKIVLNWGRLPDEVAATEETAEKGYEFEGYNVYQIPSLGASLDQGIRLATFDRINELTTISQETFDPVSGQILSLPVQFGTNSGVSRTITITRDELREQPLANGQQYFFGVSAYNFNGTPGLTSKTLESTLGSVQAVPQGPKPGTRFSGSANNTLTIDHEGSADASVTAEIVDPSAFIDADYTLQFFQDTVAVDDTTNNIFITWDVLLPNGESVFPERRTNLTTSGAGADNQLNFNGLLVRAGGAVTFAAPATFLTKSFVTDADPSDPGLDLWFDGTAFANTGDLAAVIGGGFPIAATEFLQQDIEFRFTGVPAADAGADVDVRNDSPIVEGGQWGTQWDQTIGGTPASMAGAASVPVRLAFELWDIENNRQVNVLVVNRNSDGASPYGSGVGDPNTPGMEPRWRIAGRDYIIPHMSDYDEEFAMSQPFRYDGQHSSGRPNSDFTTWFLFFHQGGAAGAGDTWTTGDVYRLTYPNPVIPGVDKWKFSTTAPSSDDATAREDVAELTNVFPNPYFGFNSREQNLFQRFVTFSHLPQRANIRIFNLAGILVRTIVKDDDSQFINWDLNNESGLPVASGIYVANVEFPDLNTSKNIKMALIKEQQFLRNF